MRTRRYLLLKAKKDTAIYRMTVMELVRRGFKFSAAKMIVKNSTLLEDAKTCWSISRDMGHKEWAEYALANQLEPDMKAAI